MSQPTPLAWPEDLGFGTITGRFVYLDGDSDDTGDEPDLIPAAGGKVTVEANAALAAYTGASPLTAVKRRVEGIIDAEGYLCRKTSSGMPGPRGLSVVATDNDTLSTTGFNYKVTVELPGAKIPPMNVSVPAGVSIDLTTAVTEAVSGGTTVVALTPEIRAEIARAVESVQPDTTGLATEDALATGLATKVDQSTFDTTVATLATEDALNTALAGKADTADLDAKADTSALAELQATVPSTEDIEAIALENALLNEEQPLVKAELVDGVLVLTRRDGVELTVEGSTSLAPSSVVWRLPWPSLLGTTNGGWLSREGNVVTLRIQDPSVRNGLDMMTVPHGFKPVKSRDQMSMLDAYAVTLEGTVIGGAAAFWDATLQARIPEALRNMVDTGQVNAETGAPIMEEQSQAWSSLTVRWLTVDPMPDPAQTEDTDPNAPLQLAP